jgi:methylmalonyl-CoA epimerase
MVTGVFGVNIAVQDLDAAVKKYEGVLGIKAEPFRPEDFAFPGLKGAKLDVGGVYINLISYTDNKTSIAKFIESKGEGLFLLSFKVADFDKDIEVMKANGAKPLLEKPIDVEVGRVNFIHPKSMHGVQLEIIQTRSK